MKATKAVTAKRAVRGRGGTGTQVQQETVHTILVVGLSPATVKALRRLLGKWFYIERVGDAVEYLRSVRNSQTVAGIVVNPALSEFDAPSLLVYLGRYLPELPLFLFGSAQGIESALRGASPEAMHCFRSPFEICGLARAIAACAAEGQAMPSLMRRESSLIVSTLEFIEVNYPSISSVTHISSRLGVSREHLTRQFTRHVGYTLWDFLTLCRTEKAKELLANGLLVKQVFREVGFKCESSFFRAFVKHTGTTPRAYGEAMLARELVVRGQQSLTVSLRGPRVEQGKSQSKEVRTES